MPLSSIFGWLRKPARRSVNRHRSPIVTIEAQRGRRPMVPSPFSSNASLASEAPTEEVPDFVRPFAIPEVAPEPPQGNGYGSFLPEDAIPDLQTVLASCGQRMISLSTGDGLLGGRNVVELEHAIVHALQRIRILRNDARPIAKLPPEVLIPIFEFIATPSEDISSTSAFRNLMSLVHVCRYWRVTLLNHRGVWSNVHLRGQDPKFLAWQMGYARNTLLDVTVDLDSNSGNRSSRNLQASVKTIREHRESVRSLSVRVARHHHFQDHHFQDFFNSYFPNLEELAFGGRGLDPPAQLIGAPVWNANQYPKLRRLSVKGVPNWPVLSTTGLTGFKLEGPMVVTVTEISRFLEQNRTLESLEFVNLHVPAGVRGRIESIKLYSLTTLTFRNVEHGHIFPYMSLPALKDLHIGSFDEPLGWAGTIWQNLSLPSGITSLNVKYRGWEDGIDRVCITGFDDKHTPSLNLTERSVGTRFNPMLSALTRALLHSNITSISFDERGTNDPRFQLSSPPLQTVLRRLQKLRRMDLCWGHLTHQIIGQLGHTCPELKVLRVKTTRLSCSATFSLVLRMAKARAAAGMRLDKIECVVGEDEGDAVKTRELWDDLARNAELERYLGDGPEVTEANG